MRKTQVKEKRFNPVKINLHNLIAEEIKSNQVMALQKHIRISFSIEREMNVFADEQMVKTVVRNLVSNALKYTRSEGEVLVYAEECEQHAVVVVKDTGIGMSTDAKDNLFKTGSFYSTLGTDNEKGAGLGLMISKEFIEINGGFLHVESEPGKGSEFKFTLSEYNL